MQSSLGSLDTKPVQLRAINSFPCRVLCEKELNNSFVSLVCPMQDPRVFALYFSACGSVYQKYCYVFPLSPKVSITAQYPYILLSNGTVEHTIEFETKQHMVQFLKLVTSKITEIVRNKLSDKEIFDCFFNKESANKYVSGLTKIRHQESKSILRISGTHINDPIAVAMLVQQEKNFREYFEKSIRVITWNIDQKLPPENVNLLLGDTTKRHDLYVFCFQEIDMSMDCIMHGDSKEKKEAWDKGLARALGNFVESYSYIGGVQLGTSYIAVFGRDPASISNVTTSSVTIGAMGFFNKTAVGISFSYLDTNLCFISSHFSHGRKNLERRNSEFWNIQSEMTFKTPVGDLGVDDHDAIFWCGDFNYRLTLSDTESREKFNETSYLLDHDQLILSHRQNKVFVGYNEMEIKFRPTYKFDKGTETLDTSSKQRGPAWCDRIFHRVPGAIPFITQRSYNSVKGLLMSDHHPVAADFGARVWRNDHDKAMKLYEEIMLKVDVLKWKTLLNTDSIDFKTVNLGEQKSQIVKLRNEGQIPVLFHVLTDVPWLSCHPTKATVLPDREIELLVSISIDISTQVQSPVITSNIVKYLKISYPSGKPPNFIMIQAHFNMSLIGLPLEYLYRLPCELSKLPSELFIPRDTKDYKTAQIMNYPARVNDCWELNNLFTALKLSIDDPQIFTKPGQSEEMTAIANSLKSRKDVSTQNFTQYGLFSVLFSIIECTKDPLFPYEALRNWDQREDINIFLNSIPDNNRMLFNLVTNFFGDIIRKFNNNGIQLDIPTVVSYLARSFTKNTEKSLEAASVIFHKVIS